MANIGNLTIPTIRLGMLTPSSNTVLEPVLAHMCSAVRQVSVHYSRFPVTEISLREAALGQFDNEPMLRAAELLADANVHNICWNGTSAGWLGFERDRELCEQIEQRTGVRATTSVLALADLMRLRSIRRFALVTPYVDDVQARIVETFGREGFECVAESHARRHVNFSFASITPAQIAERIREVASSRPEAIVVFCTNMWGAEVAAELEAELSIPVLDTVATALWGGIRDAGGDPAIIRNYGELFNWK